jgi:hypothetical protein
MSALITKLQYFTYGFQQIISVRGPSKLAFISLLGLLNNSIWKIGEHNLFSLKYISHFSLSISYYFFH